MTRKLSVLEALVIVASVVAFVTGCYHCERARLDVRARCLTECLRSGQDPLRCSRGCELAR